MTSSAIELIGQLSNKINFYFFCLVVTVEFTETEYTVGEEEGQVEVCLSLDTPIATPLNVSVESLQATPTSAEGKKKMSQLEE